MRRSKKQVPPEIKIPLPIKFMIEIEPQVEYEKGPGKSYTFLSFKVKCNGQESWGTRIVGIIQGSSNTKRDEENWRFHEEYWDFQRRYIAENAGQALVGVGTQIIEESQLFGRQDTDLDKHFASSLDLKHYTDRISVHYQGKPGEPMFDSWFQAMVADYAMQIRSRLTGLSNKNIGFSQSLVLAFYGDTSFPKLYEELCKEYSRARTNAKARTALSERNDIFEDLRKALFQRRKPAGYKYKPSDIALVAAARKSGIKNADLSKLSSLRRLLRERRAYLQHATKLGLKVPIVE